MDEHRSAELPAEEARFVERLRKAWGPPPLSPAEAAAFDTELSGRLEGRRRPTLWGLGLAMMGAAVAALALAFVLLRAPLPTQDWVGALAKADGEIWEPSDTVEALGWESGDVYAEDDSFWWQESYEESQSPWLAWLDRTDADEAVREVLPADYLALAYLAAIPEPSTDD